MAKTPIKTLNGHSLVDETARTMAQEALEKANEGGGGLPTGGEPFKQLVTDANGNTVWEDRTHYARRYNITWDGDATGREKIEFAGSVYFKIADESSVDSIIGADVSMKGLSELFALAGVPAIQNDFTVIDSQVIWDETNSLYAVISDETVQLPILILIPNDTVEYKSGLYSVLIYEGTVIGNFTVSTPVRVISINGEEVVQIPSKFLKEALLPESVVAESPEVYNLNLEWDYSSDASVNDKDKILFNGFTYYKVSDVAVAYKFFKNCSTVNKNSDGSLLTADTSSYAGENCYKAGNTIVVVQAGECKLQSGVNNSTIRTFTAPSAGVYFFTMGNPVTRWTSVASYEFIDDLIDGFCISKSNGNKYIVGMDNEGVLRAVKVN